jgi:hypothetical protein
LGICLSVEQICKSLNLSEVELAIVKCPPCELARLSVPHPNFINAANRASHTS